MSDFQVTVISVIDKLPLDASQITATTAPISTVRIEAWIEEAESELKGLLRRAGLNPNSLSQEVREQMATATRSYAVSQSLKAYGMGSQSYETYHRQYQEVFDRYQEDPSTISGVRTQARTNKRKTKFSNGYGW